MLVCGTETAVYFSLDDGENWQPLRLNMPATSIRDLVVHNDDIVVGTHGRSFWILDDITPLRQINKEVTTANAYLFAPQTAIRVKRSVHTDTPFPPEEPMGQNPPDGAIINYVLKEKSATPVVLEIFDSTNKLVRRFASDDKPLPYDVNKLRFPTYWLRPPQILPSEAGMQPFRLGFAVSESARRKLRFADFRHLQRHAVRSRRSVCNARKLHGKVNRER